MPMFIRKFSTAATAAAVVAITLTAAGAGVAHSQPTVAPTTDSEAVQSTVGGCRSTTPQLIRLCTGLHINSSQTPLMLTLNPTGTHIVVLGAGLLPDGSIRPVLESRLQAALLLARTYPTAPIIVTGGVPRSGVTEAAAMRRWLVANGVSPQRITEEGASRSTVENATFTSKLLTARHATGAVVVTSPDHLERALVDFRTAVDGAIPVDGTTAAAD
ncbi:YdcF family protein [Aldersonia sp. NBC_00410]|uniref:YdcF family protein n=1 Tax=Aldersonia sp. NBC_00410 TaxID=2975954 RepID=UPI002258C4E7|nr:YdcF family protein [Aldersonia sp. NBC_00410]MCX5044708.1 YdcF family protein [Aldersonia sp. NBC_00410]